MDVESILSALSVGTCFPFASLLVRREVFPSLEVHQRFLRVRDAFA